MSMKCRVFDYPTRFYVTSEENHDNEYLVILTDHRVCVNGQFEFNGSCNCANFCIGAGRSPSLKRQIIESGHTIIRRCKHIRFAREHALDICLDHLHRADPNLPEEEMT